MTLLASLLVGVSGAQASGVSTCRFAPRAQHSELMSALPDYVIGLAKCDQAGLGDFLVSKFKKPSDQAVSSALQRLPRLVVYDSTGSTIISEVSVPGGTKRIVESRRWKGEPYWHYVITTDAPGGYTLMYLHSAGREQTRKLRAQLEAARAALSPAERRHP